MDKRCGTCAWATEFRMTKHNPPRFAPNTVSMCSWPLPEQILCDSITGYSGYGPNSPRRYMRPEDGTNCPCWKEKEVGAVTREEVAP